MCVSAATNRKGQILAGSAASAGASIAAGKIAHDAGQSQRDNLRLQARLSRARGRVQAQEFRRDGARVAGSIASRAAAAGVDPTVGSASSLAAEAVENAELDAQTIKANALLETFGYKAAGRAAELAGQAARSRGYTRAARTLLGGAGKAKLFGGS